MSLEGNDILAQLEFRVATAFNLSPSDVALRYQDSFGDHLELVADDDLQDAIDNTTKDKLPLVFVVRKRKAFSASMQCYTTHNLELKDHPLNDTSEEDPESEGGRIEILGKERRCYDEILGDYDDPLEPTEEMVKICPNRCKECCSWPIGIFLAFICTTILIFGAVSDMKSASDPYPHYSIFEKHTHGIPNDIIATYIAAN